MSFKIGKILKLKEKILLSLFIYNVTYSLILSYFSSLKASLILLGSNLFFTTVTYLLIQSKKYDYARSLIILFGCVFIFLVSNFLGAKSSSEFYYLAVAILPLIFFEGSRKLALSFLMFILLLWRVQKEKLHLVDYLFDNNLPTEFFFNLNFVGSFLLTLIFFKLFLDQWSIAKEDLLKNNLRQDYILEGAGLGAWDWWLDDNIVIFDKRWCEMIGLDPNHTPMQFSTWESRIHPEDKAKVFAHVNNHLEGKTSLYESIHRVRHTNGTWVWILARGRFSEYDSDGKPVRFTGTHLEITKSKELEAQMEEAQQVAKIGSWAFDLKDQSIKWSKQMFSLFNEDVLEGPPSYEKHIMSIHPEDREFWRATVEGCISTGVPYQFRFRTYVHDKIVWLEAIGRAKRDIDGSIVGLSGTCQDVTSLVETEENAKKEKAKVMQNSKLTSLGEMSAGVAHEINNPLAIIDGMIHILNMEKPDYLGAKPSYEIIQKATERISKIVKGLKKFSRTSEKSNLQLHSLNQVIEESLVLLNIRAKQFSATIKFNHSDKYFIYCDEIEIQQVIINLVNNSLDAIKDLPERTIQIDVFESDLSIHLQVRDSGVRISEKYVKKLFEPFFTTKKVGEGTGLGLSIVKGILDDHDASIELLVEEPRTCFEIKFKKPELV